MEKDTDASNNLSSVLRFLILAGVIYLISGLSSMDDSINDLRERMARLEGLMESHLILPHSDNTVARNINK